MIRRCCVCKRILGEVEPLEDKGITDTYCYPCRFRTALDWKLRDLIRTADDILLPYVLKHVKTFVSVYGNKSIYTNQNTVQGE